MLDSIGTLLRSQHAELGALRAEVAEARASSRYWLDLYQRESLASAGIVDVSPQAAGSPAEERT